MRALWLLFVISAVTALHTHGSGNQVSEDTPVEVVTVAPKLSLAQLHAEKKARLAEAAEQRLARERAREEEANRAREVEEAANRARAEEEEANRASQLAALASDGTSGTTEVHERDESEASAPLRTLLNDVGRQKYEEHQLKLRRQREAELAAQVIAERETTEPEAEVAVDEVEADEVEAEGVQRDAEILRESQVDPVLVTDEADDERLAAEMQEALYGLDPEDDAEGPVRAPIPDTVDQLVEDPFRQVLDKEVLVNDGIVAYYSKRGLQDKLTASDFELNDKGMCKVLRKQVQQIRTKARGGLFSFKSFPFQTKDPNNFYNRVALVVARLALSFARRLPADSGPVDMDTSVTDNARTRLLETAELFDRKPKDLKIFVSSIVHKDIFSKQKFHKLFTRTQIEKMREVLQDKEFRWLGVSATTEWYPEIVTFLEDMQVGVAPQGGEATQAIAVVVLGKEAKSV